MDALHRRWNPHGQQIEWSPIWRALWIAWRLPRARLITWRISNHAYYTNYFTGPDGGLLQICVCLVIALVKLSSICFSNVIRCKGDDTF